MEDGADGGWGKRRVEGEGSEFGGVRLCEGCGGVEEGEGVSGLLSFSRCGRGCWGGSCGEGGKELLEEGAGGGEGQTEPIEAGFVGHGVAVGAAQSVEQKIVVGRDGTSLSAAATPPQEAPGLALTFPQWKLPAHAAFCSPCCAALPYGDIVSK